MAESEYLERISQLEAQLKEKDNEIESLQSTVKQISEHAKLSGDIVFKLVANNIKIKTIIAYGICFTLVYLLLYFLYRIQEKKSSIQRKLLRSTSVLLKSFVPELIGHTRRQIEDYCRDLVINNDHIRSLYFKTGFSNS